MVVPASVPPAMGSNEHLDFNWYNPRNRVKRKDVYPGLSEQEGEECLWESEGGGDDSRPCPTNGHWRDADWLGCRDGKWRPVEPGLEPLADGSPERVGRLRGYGNAIVAQQAQAFIESYMDVSNT